MRRILIFIMSIRSFHPNVLSRILVIWCDLLDPISNANTSRSARRRIEVDLLVIANIILLSCLDFMSTLDCHSLIVNTDVAHLTLIS